MSFCFALHSRACAVPGFKADRWLLSKMAEDQMLLMGGGGRAGGSAGGTNGSSGSSSGRSSGRSSRNGGRSSSGRSSGGGKGSISISSSSWGSDSGRALSVKTSRAHTLGSAASRLRAVRAAGVELQLFDLHGELAPITHTPCTEGLTHRSNRRAHIPHYLPSEDTP